MVVESVYRMCKTTAHKNVTSKVPRCRPGDLVVGADCEHSAKYVKKHEAEIRRSLEEGNKMYVWSSKRVSASDGERMIEIYEDKENGKTVDYGVKVDGKIIELPAGSLKAVESVLGTDGSLVTEVPYLAGPIDYPSSGRLQTLRERG